MQEAHLSRLWFALRGWQPSSHSHEQACPWTAAQADGSAHCTLSSPASHLLGLTPAYLSELGWRNPPLGSFFSVLQALSWVCLQCYPCLLDVTLCADCLLFPQDGEALEGCDWVLVAFAHWYFNEHI